MKTIKNTLLLLAFATATLFTSCSKSDSAAATTTTPAAADGFTWTENGGTTVMTGYTPYFVTQGHSLFVQNATGGVLFEFNFNSLAPATNVLGGITFNPGAVFYVLINLYQLLELVLLLVMQMARFLVHLLLVVLQEQYHPSKAHSITLRFNHKLILKYVFLRIVLRKPATYIC
jgi:hypothetical protein